MHEPKYFFKFTESIVDKGKVWYTIQVHTKSEDQEPIIFKSRYSELREIHERCEHALKKGELPDFPEKKLLNNTKEEFIQKRKKELENYYNTLAKTFDIQKLKDLHQFIEQHRKKKDLASKPAKGMDEAGKIEAKMKKENQLRNGFEAIYKEIQEEFIDMSEDFHPFTEDSSKRFMSDLQKIKPSEAQLLAPVAAGLESNLADFWSMFFEEDHQNFMVVSKQVCKGLKEIQEKLEKDQKSHSLVMMR